MLPVDNRFLAIFWMPQVLGVDTVTRRWGLGSGIGCGGCYLGLDWSTWCWTINWREAGLLIWGEVVGVEMLLRREWSGRGGQGSEGCDHSGSSSTTLLQASKIEEGV